MLANIYKEIFDYSKKKLVTTSKYELVISKEMIEQPDSFPIVIIKEYQDRLEDETLSKVEQKLRLLYQIEIYATDYNLTNKKVAKLEVINELKEIVNEIFENDYGMTRTASRPLPNIDAEVGRHFMEFECIYDTNTGIIYRR